MKTIFDKNKRTLSCSPMFVAALLAFANCSAKPESGVTSTEGTDYQHPGSATNPTTSTTTTSAAKIVSSNLSLTAEIVLELGSTKVTIPAGAVHKLGTAKLQNFSGSFVNSAAVRMVSEPMVLSITGTDSKSFTIDEIFKDITIEQSTQTKTNPSKATLLLIENSGKTTETKTGLSRSSINDFFTDRGSGVFKMTFPMRLSQVAFVLAETSNGTLPSEYAAYTLPPKDPAGLSVGVTGATDATLYWSGDPRYNAAYAIVYWTSEESEEYCTYNDKEANAKTADTITADTKTAGYYANYTGLSPGKTYYVKICGLSSRSPADASSGTTVSFATPSRPVAILTGTPADPSNTTALNVTVSGTDVTEYQYAVLTNASNCSSATMSDWTLVSVPITDTINQSTGDTVRLCVNARISAATAQIEPTTYSWTVDKTAPAFTSLTLAAPAADGYLSTTDRAATTSIVGTLTASDYTAALTAYKVVTNATTCNGALTYSTTEPGANSTDITTDGVYKVCIRLSDDAFNYTYGTSSTVTVDTTISFTSVSLANDAANSYINLAETATTNALTGNAAGAGYTTRKYVLTTWATTCNNALTYSTTIPKSNSATFTSDGDYKVCVEMSDTAGNTAYGNSNVIHLDKTIPSFTAISLANDVADTYLNTADHALTSNLSSAATGAGYDSLTYAVVDGGTACSAAGSWSASIPQENDAGISADGSTYKVCAKFTDLAGNPTVYGATATFTYDNTAPAFTALPLLNDALDGYVNATDASSGLAVHDVATATGSSAESYSLTSSGTTCDGALTYQGAAILASDVGLTSGSTFKICVKLVDAAGNITYGNSSNIIVDKSTPDCTSINLANGATDFWLNSSEVAANTALSAASSTTLASPIKTYAIIASAAACDNSASFGAQDTIPTSSDAALVDGSSFKICAKVTDVADNTPAYCATATFAVDVTAPSFTSIDLANDAVDTYINITEHGAASDLVTNLTGSGYASANYVIAASATTCDGLLTYAGTVPQTTSSTLNSSGTYKVCVSLTDTAGNVSYGSSNNFDSDQVAPTFTSIDLANDATGGYINLAESASASDSCSNLVAAGQNTTSYATVTSAAACSTGVYAGGTPTVATIAGLGDGSYKVCTKLVDTAGNITYGASSTIVVDLTAPSFTAAALANDATDTYINATEHTTTNALTSAATGSGYDTVNYAVTTDATGCNTLVTWSSSIPKSNDADFGVDGDYKVCVKMSDYAGNTDAYGNSNTIHLKTDYPTFTSLALANDAADQYVNATEHTSAVDLASTLVGAGYASDTYAVAASGSTCNSSLTYGTMPLQTDAGLSAAGTFKICTQLTDVAGNKTYGSTLTFDYDPTAPVYTSIDLTNDVSDSWLNATEHATTNALAGNLTASGYTAAQYAVVTSATTCNAGVSYNSMPQSDDASLAHGGTYKICVKLSDAAGNISYGTSASTFQTDFNAPSFTAVSLTGNSADGFINTSDVSGNTAIVGAATGTDYNTAAYVVVSSGTACNGALTYGAIPTTGDAAMSSDGTYKVCVKLTDTASNTPSYGPSSNFVKDSTNPTSTVTTTGSITPSTTAGVYTQIDGTASDATAGVASVQVSIQEGSGGCYNPTANDFSSVCPSWLSATGTTSWTYQIPDSALQTSVTYTVQSKATDLAVSTGNIQTSYGSSTFTFTATEGQDLWNNAFVYDNGGADKPYAGAVDSTGNLFVVGYHTATDKNWMIKKLDTRGNEDTTSWNKDVGDVGSDEIAYGVALDTSNNVYVVGSRHNGSNLDWWLKAYNSSGVEDTVNWDIILDGNSSNDEATAVAVDSSNNIYIVGYGTNIAGGSTGEDMWIRKYNSSGALSCEQKIDGGASLSDRALSVTVNNTTSKFYVAGYITAGGGDQQMFVKRLRASDCTVEASATGNSSGTNDQASVVRLDSSGNVYVAGRDSSADSDWWIRKYSAALALQSEMNTAVASSHDAFAMAIDSSNNIYVGGYKTVGTQDWWLRQFNTSLTEDTANWDKIIDAASGHDQITSIVIGTGTNDIGHVYVIGWGTNIHGVASGADWWIRKYSN
jgi:hypothetical protein